MSTLSCWPIRCFTCIKCSDLSQTKVTHAFIHSTLLRLFVYSVDLFIQSDARPSNSDSIDWVCAGNFYLRATRAAATFIDEALLLMHRSGLPDQDCFQLILTGNAQELSLKKDVEFRTAKQIGLTFRILDVMRIANGGVYFAYDLNKV